MLSLGPCMKSLTNVSYLIHFLCNSGFLSERQIASVNKNEEPLGCPKHGPWSQNTIGISSPPVWLWESRSLQAHLSRKRSCIFTLMGKL